MHDPNVCEESSGNVFADLELPDPEIRLVKAKLARQIAQVIVGRGWKQTEAADALGLHQPEVRNSEDAARATDDTVAAGGG